MTLEVSVNHPRMSSVKHDPLPQEDDIARLFEEYAHRRKHRPNRGLHSLFDPGDLFMIQQRQRDLLALIKREGLFPLSDKRILEIGCAAGGVLLEFLSFGATPGFLHGVEMLPWHIKTAQSVTPHLPLVKADGRYLPFPDGCFDIVMQFTVFSSILSNDVRRAVADEMRRVLSPNGMILWYDCWINPINPQTRGIRQSEIRELFPGCKYSLRRITLAPPLVRLLAPYSWVACCLLERLRVFNSHYLAGIKPQNPLSVCGVARP